MSLWKFYNKNKYGNVRSRIIHTEGSQLSINPNGFGKMIMAHIFKYEIEESLLPPRLFETNGKKYIVPGWIEVHPKTELSDIKIKKKKKRVVKDIHTVQSGSGEYKVRFNPNTEKYTCNCMGFWRVKDKEKGCKHIIEVRDGEKR